MRVDPEMSVRKAHALSHAVADAISQRLPHTTVTIHIEPFIQTRESDPGTAQGTREI